MKIYTWWEATAAEQHAATEYHDYTNIYYINGLSLSLSLFSLTSPFGNSFHLIWMRFKARPRNHLAFPSQMKIQPYYVYYIYAKCRRHVTHIHDSHLNRSRQFKVFNAHLYTYHYYYYITLLIFSLKYSYCVMCATPDTVIPLLYDCNSTTPTDRPTDNKISTSWELLIRVHIVVIIIIMCVTRKW